MAQQAFDRARRGPLPLAREFWQLRALMTSRHKFMSVWLSTPCLPVCLSVCLFVSLSDCLSVSLAVGVVVCVCDCHFATLTLHLFICVSLSKILSVCRICHLICWSASLPESRTVTPCK